MFVVEFIFVFVFAFCEFIIYVSFRVYFCVCVRVYFCVHVWCLVLCLRLLFGFVFMFGSVVQLSTPTHYDDDDVWCLFLCFVFIIQVCVYF